MSLFHVLAVFVGGGIGSVFRFLVGLYVQKIVNVDFPVGTFVVNALGCFLVGVAFSVLVEHFEIATVYRLLFITGFLGGFTTFSTFSYDATYMFVNGQYLKFLLYTMATVFVGYLLTLAGYYIGKGV